MTKTEYLTGNTPDTYKEHIDPLVTQRLKDMKALLSELSWVSSGMDKQGDDYKKLVKRYKDIEKAIGFWTALKYEGDDFDREEEVTFFS